MANPLPLLCLPYPKQQPDIPSGSSPSDRTIAPARSQDPVVQFLNDVAGHVGKTRINVAFWRTQYQLYKADPLSGYVLPLTEQILGGAE